MDLRGVPGNFECEINPPINSILDELKELEQALGGFSKQVVKDPQGKAAMKSVAMHMSALINCIREISTSASNQNNDDVREYCRQVIYRATAALTDRTEGSISHLKSLARESRIPENLLPSVKQKIIGLIKAIAGCLAIVGSIFLAKMAIASSITPPGMGFGLLASFSAYQGCSWVKNGLSYFSLFGGNGVRKEVGDKINSVSEAFQLYQPANKG